MCSLLVGTLPSLSKPNPCSSAIGRRCSQRLLELFWAEPSCAASPRLTLAVSSISAPSRDALILKSTLRRLEGGKIWCKNVTGYKKIHSVLAKRVCRGVLHQLMLSFCHRDLYLLLEQLIKALWLYCFLICTLPFLGLASRLLPLYKYHFSP